MAFQVEGFTTVRGEVAAAVTATPTGVGTATGGGGGTGAVTHGSQLTINSVGPWTLQGVAKGSETLWTVSAAQAAERLETDSNWGRPSYIPGTNYVYNNNTSNHGGVVPAGGMNIDGYTVAAGTWVVQFADYNGQDIIIAGDVDGTAPAWPGVIFRGCRFRGLNDAGPGFLNFNAQASNGRTWVMYCDGGGTGWVAPNVTSSTWESQGNGRPNSHLYVIRSYVSQSSTNIFLRGDADAAIENWCEGSPRFYSDDTFHLNGIANGGGEAGTLWLRNHCSFSPQPGYPTNPYFKSQNDVIQMAADGGAYPGTATLLDGSVGYQIRDNYLGGADHTLQLGLDKSNTGPDVRNVVVTGNTFTTYWFAQSGEQGIAYKTPVWDSYGNTWANNTWADDYGTGSWSPTTGNAGRQYPSGNGPRTGTAISAPSVS